VALKLAAEHCQSPVPEVHLQLHFLEAQVFVPQAGFLHRGRLLLLQAPHFEQGDLVLGPAQARLHFAGRTAGSRGVARLGFQLPSKGETDN